MIVMQQNERKKRVRPSRSIDESVSNAESSVSFHSRRRASDDRRQPLRPTILVVDDDDLVRRTLKLELQYHYFIKEANDGIEGLEILRKFVDEIDCVVTDIRMPRLNGSEYMARAAEITRDIYFVVITGHKGEITESELIGSGGGRLSGYLEKPVEGGELTYQVQKAIDLTRLQRDRIRANENAHRLVESIENIHRLRNLEQLLSAIFENVILFSSVEIGFLAFQDEIDGQLRIYGGAGRFRDLVGQPVFDNPHLRADEVALLSHAIETDVLQETEEVMVIPLGQGGMILCGQPIIDQRDRQFIHTFARNAAQVLANTLYFEQLIEKKRLEEELKIASDIQISLLPRRLPQLNDIEVHGFQVAAHEVGGDYYDFIEIEGGHLGICIGDVAGKGMPAGLVMVMVRSYLRMLINEAIVFGNRKRSKDSLAYVLRMVNKELYRDIGADLRFITLTIIIWDAQDQQLRYIGAGHERFLIHRVKTQQVENHKPGGVVLGLIPDIDQHIHEQEIPFLPGDTLFLFTDGITEARSPDGNMYGFERLTYIFAQNAQQTPEAIVKSVQHDVSNHMAGTPPTDDITLVALRRKPELPS